jgi:hypothetical protein
VYDHLHMKKTLKQKQSATIETMKDRPAEWHEADRPPTRTTTPAMKLKILS